MQKETPYPGKYNPNYDIRFSNSPKIIFPPLPKEKISIQQTEPIGSSVEVVNQQAQDTIGRRDSMVSIKVPAIEVKPPAKKKNDLLIVESPKGYKFSHYTNRKDLIIPSYCSKDSYSTYEKQL